MNKEAEISILLDLYGGALSKVQFESVDLYYNQDLSLSEISYHTGKSRQGVRDAIKRAESTLLSMESSLGFLKKFKNIRESVEMMKSLLSEIDYMVKSEDSLMKCKVKSLKDIVSKLDYI